MTECSAERQRNWADGRKFRGATAEETTGHYRNEPGKLRLEFIRLVLQGRVALKQKKSGHRATKLHIARFDIATGLRIFLPALHGDASGWKKLLRRGKFPRA
jgi:hypothetical protein